MHIYTNIPTYAHIHIYIYIYTYTHLGNIKEILKGSDKFSKEIFIYNFAISFM